MSETIDLASGPRTPGLILQRDRKSGAPVEVAIPGELLIACPLRQNKLRAAVKCEACEHFRGIGDRFPGDGTFAFEDRYRILCSYPRNLPLIRIETADD
jgi:hypothetical protein